MSDSREADNVVGGRYRLLQPIGRGGMGTVWRAHDEVLGRDVALKEITPPPDLGGHERETFIHRTFREARAAGRVSHPGVAAVYDVVQDRGHPWIAMELLPSRTLGTVVREEGRLAPPRAAGIGAQILAALVAAHRAGVLHRDVKPENVMIADNGRVVLTDFGIATVEGDPSVTRTGALIGTPAFIAPERAAGGPAERASDLWSLGVTLYVAVEGRVPFERPHALATLAAVLHDEPAPFVHAGRLAPVIAGLLRKDPAERTTAEELAPLLSAVASGYVPQSTAPISPVAPVAPMASGALAAEAPPGRRAGGRGRARTRDTPGRIPAVPAQRRAGDGTGRAAAQGDGAPAWPLAVPRPRPGGPQGREIPEALGSPGSAAGWSSDAETPPERRPTGAVALREGTAPARPRPMPRKRGPQSRTSGGRPSGAGGRGTGPRARRGSPARPAPRAPAVAGLIGLIMAVGMISGAASWFLTPSQQQGTPQVVPQIVGTRDPGVTGTPSESPSDTSTTEPTDPPPTDRQVGQTTGPTQYGGPTESDRRTDEDEGETGERTRPQDERADEQQDDKSGKSNKPDKSGKSEDSKRPEKSDKSEKTNKSDKSKKQKAPQDSDDPDQVPPAPPAAEDDAG